jgi:antitoxin HicB
MDETRLSQYTKLDYPTELFKRQERWFIRFSDLPGCIADGVTREEAIARGDEAKALWLETALEIGREIPAPSQEPRYSGKLVLRLPKGLHEAAAQIAQRDAVSLNSCLVQFIAEGVQRSGLKNLLNNLETKLEKAIRGANFRANASDHEVNPRVEFKRATRRRLG